MNQNPNFHSFPYQPYRNEPNSQPLPTPPRQSPYQPYAYPQNPMPQPPRYPTFEENPVQPRHYPQDVPYHNRYPTLPQFQAPTEPHYPMDSPNSYPRIIIQQGVVYQPVPGVEHIVVPSPSQYNDQSLNNQSSMSYEQQIDRSMTHQDQNQLIQNYVAVPSREGQANYPESEIHRIETKIKSGFCCYTLLVWIGIIGAIVGVVTSLVVRGKFRGKLVAISLSVILLLGLIFALKAKKRMRSRKQFLVFIFFCLMTITHLVLSILGFVMYLRGARYHGSHGSHGYYGHSGHHGYYEEERGHCHGGRNVGMKIALGIFTILVPFVLHVILICCARTLVKLMKERELLLHNFRVQRI